MSTPIILSLMLFQAAASAPGADVKPVTAQASAPPAADPQPTETADPVVCHWVTDSGHPAFPQKQCHKTSVWAKMARDAG